MCAMLEAIRSKVIRKGERDLLWAENEPYKNGSDTSGAYQRVNALTAHALYCNMRIVMLYVYYHQR